MPVNAAQSAAASCFPSEWLTDDYHVVIGERVLAAVAADPAVRKELVIYLREHEDDWWADDGAVRFWPLADTILAYLRGTTP
jgi:hypothetical protein